MPLLQLGVALQLMGDETRAKVAIDEALKLNYGLQPEASDAAGAYWGEWLGDYGSRVRDLSLSYALMQRHNIAHERCEGLLFDLAADFDRRRYFSTQERLGLFLAVRSAMGTGAEAGAENGWKTTLSQGGASAAWSGSGTQQQSVAGSKLKAGVSLRNDGASTVLSAPAPI
ncbi:MAG: hypothetical protein PHH58_03600 [Rhodoferax sp.]|nr:hypothetical protein [Rhodoferax sp.]